MPIFWAQVVAEKMMPVVRTLNFHSEKSAVSATKAQKRVALTPLAIIPSNWKVKINAVCSGRIQ